MGQGIRFVACLVASGALVVTSLATSAATETGGTTASAPPAIDWWVEAFDGVALHGVSDWPSVFWWRRPSGEDEWRWYTSGRGTVIDDSLEPGESVEWRLGDHSDEENPQYSEVVTVTRLEEQPADPQGGAAFSVTQPGQWTSSGYADASTGFGPRSSIVQTWRPLDVRRSITITPRLPDGAGTYAVGLDVDIQVRPSSLTTITCRAGSLTVRESATQASGQLYLADISLACSDPLMRAEINVGQPEPAEPRRDFDGDYFTDMLARDTNGRLWLFPGRGTGSKTSPYFFPRGRAHPSTNWDFYDYLGSLGDYDSNGRSDVLARDRWGQLWFIQGTGGGSPDGSSAFLSASDWGGGDKIGGRTWGKYNDFVGIGDYDGDGNPDLLAREKTGQLWLFRGRGRQSDDTGSYFHAREPVGGATWNKYDMLVGVGDYDGDGNADLLAREKTGQLWLLRGRGRQSDDTGSYFRAREPVGGPTWNKYDLLF